MRLKCKNDKGVAGLTILLSLVTMLFVIGLLVMIFSLMGGELRDATFTPTTIAVTEENHTVAELVAGSNLTGVSYLNAVCSITAVANETAGGTVLTSGNYSLSGCELSNATLIDDGVTGWIVNYSVTYDAENTATGVMNDTTAGISSVTDWYPIFIVIGAMVVLILLTVIIITAIRGSGLMAGGSA